VLHWSREESSHSDSTWKMSNRRSGECRSNPKFYDVEASSVGDLFATEALPAL
jgi:hypothetical protein